MKRAHVQQERYLQLTLFAVFLAAAGPVSSASQPAGLAQAARDYDVAQVNGDRAILERLLADDYVLVNSGGQTETKREFIADLTDPGFHLAPYVVSHPIERRWANGAVLGGLSHLTGTASGKPFDVCLRFADVWALRKNGWQVQYTQAARAKSEDCR